MTDNLALWRFAYVLPNLLAAFGMVFVAALSWRYRSRRGGMALFVFGLGAAIWAFFEAMNFIGLSPEGIYLAWKIECLGVAVAPLAMVLFAVDYLGYGHLLTRRRVLPLCILPAAFFLASATNEWHGLMWSSVSIDTTTPFPTLANTHGPMLWVYYAYVNTLVFITIAFLLRRLRELPELQRRQVHMVLIAMAMPLLSAALYMAGLNPMRNMSLVPLGFNIAGLVLARGFLRERMFDLSPVTAHEIYRSLEDPIFVVDEADRVLSLNNAALRLLSLPDNECIGVALSDLLPKFGFERQGEVWLTASSCYDVRIAALHSVDRRFSGRLVICREITERKRMEADLRRLANTDSLTGLYNRRYLFTRGEDEINRAQRYGSPLSLIVIDIDYFKRINDSYGHEAGDRVLVEVANVLTCQSRSTDYIARMGGEEFALLLPKTDAAAAREAGMRLLHAFRQARIPVDGDSTASVTLSAGIATLTKYDTNMNDLLRRADDAMYRAKNEGRDKLVQE